jgi:UDP-N-acetyl-D-mannosaminuronic acid dehydrogenase
MGLAFKPYIDDLRESPALHINKSLINNGYHVLAAEPNIFSYPDLTIVNYLDAIKEAYVITFLVGHKEFGTLKAKHGLDFCGVTINEK